MSKINTDLTKHIARLANIPISDKEAKDLTQAFADTLAVVDQLQEPDISQIEPTHQVTGLTNVTRQDEVDESRMFTQKQALKNAKHTHQGYFVVPRILEK